MRIFRLTYFLLPTTSTDSAMNNLKQCLHYDPDSKECFAARRLVKNFGKTFDKLDNLLNSEDWKGVIALLEKVAFRTSLTRHSTRKQNEKSLVSPHGSRSPLHGSRAQGGRRSFVGCVKLTSALANRKRESRGVSLWVRCRQVGKMPMRFSVKERPCLRMRNTKRRLGLWRGLGMLVEGRMGSSNKG
jgi:hypothetical protein